MFSSLLHHATTLIGLLYNNRITTKRVARLRLFKKYIEKPRDNRGDKSKNARELSL